LPTGVGCVFQPAAQPMPVNEYTATNQSAHTIMALMTPIKRR